MWLGSLSEHRSTRSLSPAGATNFGTSYRPCPLTRKKDANNNDEEPCSDGCGDGRHYQVGRPFVHVLPRRRSAGTGMRHHFKASAERAKEGPAEAHRAGLVALAILPSWLLDQVRLDGGRVFSVGCKRRCTRQRRQRCQANACQRPARSSLPIRHDDAPSGCRDRRYCLLPVASCA